MQKKLQNLLITDSYMRNPQLRMDGIIGDPGPILTHSFGNNGFRSGFPGLSDDELSNLVP
jgi:hypothetical protein